MGFLDRFRRILTGSSGRERVPAPHDPALLALEAAQRRRRQAPVASVARKRPVAPGAMARYERLERLLVLDLRVFPYSPAQARAALAARGFKPAEAEAYLASPAARKLLE